MGGIRNECRTPVWDPGWDPGQRVSMSHIELKKCLGLFHMSLLLKNCRVICQFQEITLSHVTICLASPVVAFQIIKMAVSLC